MADEGGPATTSGRGYGLTGLAERVALAGGTWGPGPRASAFRGGGGAAGDDGGACVVTVRVLVADDNALLRAGLVTVLGSDASLEVVGEAADGRAAVRLVSSSIRTWC